MDFVSCIHVDIIHKIKNTENYTLSRKHPNQYRPKFCAYKGVPPYNTHNSNGDRENVVGH